MVKKVVAIEDCSISGITEGENYVVHSSDSEIFTILNDRGFYYKALKHKFKPLEEEMEIKVGSEWVLKVYENRKCKVLYVGKQSLFGEWCNGEEGEYDIEDFLDKYKPAPVRRTVWLNVYDDDVDLYESKKSADEEAADGLLYQQEVELFDPREGEKG